MLYIIQTKDPEIVKKALENPDSNQIPPIVFNPYKECVESVSICDEPMVFDVGCNINQAGGNILDDFTGTMLAHRPKAKIFAFEPVHWQNFEYNYKDNTNVKLFKIALMDKNSKRTMYCPSAHALSTFYDRKVFKTWNDPGLKKIRVTCRTIDKIAADNNIEKIDYLKIDVEGAELFVLKGANKLLSNGKINYVQFEHGDGTTFKDAKYSFKDVADFLTSFGYKEIKLINKTESLWKL